ncbi:fumarylacetoacetate hydrolase family protein [Blastococcus jejuensis]|uniref:Fumarylacetoacetate hydrolase family protein n=1 Tax=Blastococcus jejuensis TaxID=351224 RepID=A0ABP6P7X4_9ACTN
MRLVSYDGGFGRIDGDAVVPMGTDLVAWLAGTETATDGDPVPLDRLTLTAPVPRPGKILCIGLNYRDHAAETGKPLPTVPMLFAKFANSVVGDGATVAIPAATQEVDWEAELGVVIGRPARDVDSADALDHVAGYTCTNDLSARDLQRATTQFTLGKAIDGFLPMGPWLVTADEVPDPQALAISCEVNGRTVQKSSTREMVFGVAELVSFLSRTMTLEPGDIIVTGTPPGVGVARTPQWFLQPGDEVVVEIERLGRLTTHLA